MIGIFKRHFLFLILIPIVIISQYYLLKPHLSMGLNDLDEGYTVDFLYLREQYPNIFEFLFKTYQSWETVYLHQFYYVGILNQIFGENILAYHYVTHTFKILATLSTYPLFFILSGSNLVAFVSTILFAFSYATIGAFDSVVQSSDYPAILVLSIFLSIYFYLVKRGSSDFIKVVISLALLLAALVLSTERTYPVVFVILLVEITLILKNLSKASLKLAGRRGGILLSPIFLMAILKPKIITVMIEPSWRDLGQRVSSGQQELLLIPFIAFASTFLPSRFWEFPYPYQALPIFLMVVTMILSALILSKKPFRFLLITGSIWLAGVLVVNLLSQHADYFINFAKVARAGFYILGLSTAFLVEWLTTKEQLYVGLFLGPFLTFIFICGIWLGTGQRGDIFMDTHRYLTTAAIFASLSLGNFIVIFYKKIHEVVIKIRFWKVPIFQPFSYVPFLLIIPILFIGAQEVEKYFHRKLSNGLARQDQIEMRQQLWSYYQNLDPKNRRLFYMDMHTDSKNNSLYGQAIFASYDSWPIFWWPHLKNFRKEMMPVIEREMENIKVVNHEGEIMLISRERFYKIENFFAFKLIDRKVIDITTQMKKELDLTSL